MVKLRILALAAVLLNASSAWACTEPPIEVPPIERLSGESDAAFSVRQAAFQEAFTFREGRRRAATRENELAQQIVAEGQRQEALWDATADILLAHVVGIGPTAVPGEYFGVRYETDHVLKGSSQIAAVNRVAPPTDFSPSCQRLVRNNYNTRFGEVVIILLPSPHSTTVEPTQILPLSAVQSDRLWAIINGTAPTP